MRAITLYQPGAYLMAHGLRTMDQRLWSDPYRGKVAIHAGRGVDTELLASLRHLGVALPATFEAGKIVAVADLVDVRPLVDSYEDAAASVCNTLTEAQLLAMYGRTETPFTGRRWNDEGERMFALVFDRIEIIAPVPVRGDQGLWTLTEAQIQDLRLAWARHRRPAAPSAS